jgi:hypothetical protein
VNGIETKYLNGEVFDFGAKILGETDSKSSESDTKSSETDTKSEELFLHEAYLQHSVKRDSYLCKHTSDNPCIH